MGRGVSSTPNDDPERLERVMDAKLRTIGVDKQALDAQIAEKKAREEDEQSATMQYTRLANYFADQVQIKQQEAAMIRKDIENEDKDFREQHQGKHTTREWDLNDPNALKSQLPARTTDDPAEAPISGLQMFDGEDLSAADRTKAQMAQCKDWWEQQKAEKEAIKAHEKQEDMAYAALLAAQERLQQDCLAQEKALRKELSTEQAGVNRDVSAKRSELEEQARRDQLEMNKNEQNYLSGSQLLTEDPTAATSSLSATRFRPDHFKGYSQENAVQVREYQKLQVQQKEERKMQEAADDMAYAQYMNTVNKALVEQERAAADFRRQQQEKSADYMMRQTTEKKERDSFLGKTLYTNEPDASYFKQFGTSHR